ncbi:MAG: hypothetical protein RLZZ28_959 [Bacteroidota bacterium]
MPLKFYRERNVCSVAKQLIGKVLVTTFDHQLTAGRIVETEAYNGMTDKASHAWNGRRTARNEHMYAAGGVAYVYICYGMHHLFNVVTHEAEIPHAVLIRALEPMVGINHMLKRCGKIKAACSITRGPGNLSKALGIDKQHSGIPLTGNEIYLLDDGFRAKKMQVLATARIGVESAGEDALLPYRFLLKNNPYVSARKS